MHPKPISPESLNQILSIDFKVRFWAKVKVGDSNQCWPWQRSLDSGGYGTVNVVGNIMKAHRVAWMAHNHCRVPDGMDILHSCIGCRVCCNPMHLRPGQDKENRKDAMDQGRAKFSKVEGTDHGMSKLTDEKVIKIRELYATGEYRQKDLGGMFGVCREMISYIVRRKNWTHLP